MAFLACYKISKGVPGGETLTVKWIVSPADGLVSGRGHLTQADPPTDITVPMHGQYDPNSKTPLVMANGAMPGAVIAVLLELPGGWNEPGVAKRVIWLANKWYHDDQDVPAEPIPCD